MGIIDSYKEWRESRRDSDHENGGLVSLNIKATANLPQHTGASGWVDNRGFYVSQSGDSRINYSQEIGDLRGSTLVMAAVQWVARSLVDARLRVIKYGTDRKETEVENHPLAMLWDKPNPYYSLPYLGLRPAKPTSSRRRLRPAIPFGFGGNLTGRSARVGMKTATTSFPTMKSIATANGYALKLMT
jgi:hypothetical protein